MLLDALAQLTYKNDVPFVVWAFWAGKDMEGNRKLSFETLRNNIGVPVFLVRPENWRALELKVAPFHPALKYLSVVHQSDYIRIYLMHHYGGAWHDVKATEVNISACWDTFKNPQIFMVGKPEVANGPAAVFNEEGKWMPDYYRELISVTSWIAKKQTPLSKNLFDAVNTLLDHHFETLKKHPARHPRERALKGKKPLSRFIERLSNRISGRSSNYPLPWTVFGNLFHPINLKYKDHIDRNLPKDAIKNAGIYHR